MTIAYQINGRDISANQSVIIISADKYEDNDNIINVSDPGLTVCPAGPSCCSRQVEARLASWSRNTFMDQLFNTTTSMAAELDAKATQVDGE